MTTSGSPEEAGNGDSIIILSDDPRRALSIKEAVGSVPAYARDRIILAPIKNVFDDHGFQPRLIILDDEKGKMDPLQWVKHVHTSSPDATLVLIAPQKDPLVASRALRAGAGGFIAGDEFESLLDEALRHIAEGERFVSDDVMQGILQGMVHTADQAEEIPVALLSDREMMVFQLLGQGKVVHAIAKELGVNIQTVATHCNNIRRKLHTVDNRQLTNLSREWVASRHHAHAHHASHS
jgi:DNA-binding NarL/FixJ family response regulator